MVSKGDLTRLSVILCPLFLAALFIPLIPHSSALEQNGAIQMPLTDNSPVIDGAWTSKDEWKDASVTSVQGVDGVFYILAKHDINNIYIMIDRVQQIDQPKGFFSSPHVKFQQGNFATVCFDTENNGGNKLESDDFCFQALYGVGNPSTNDALLYSGSNVSDQSYVFQSQVSFSSRNDPYESGRDHEIYEFSIPISFLHKSDSYGFTVMDATDRGVEVWPKGSDRQNPSSWGEILAPNQSITAPPIPVISVSTNSLSFGNEEVSGKSSPQTVTISNKGTALLKIDSVSTPDEFSISGITTPTSVPPNQSISFTVIMAPITLGQKSGVISISSNDISNPSYTISLSGTGTEKTSTPFGGKCLIATAAFGSELSPQVQFLRDFRDSHILQTKDGSSFMSAFNAWYYSFSPYVADYERGQPWMQQIVRGAIYPLLGILTASEKAYSILPGEYGSLSAGLVASSLIGAVYFWPFALAAPQVRKGNRLNYKLAAISFAVVSTATVFSIIVGNEIAMMVTTSLFVLTLVGIFATISAKTVVKALKKFI